MNTLTKLTSGSLGLARTYWLFGVGGSALLGLAIVVIAPEPGSTLARALLLGAAVALVPVLIGIWRAAGAYTGRKAWATLARAAVGLSVALFYLPLLVALVAK